VTKKFVKSAKNVAAAAPSKSSGEPAAARYHYHMNRHAGTVVLHKSLEIGGKKVDTDLDSYEFGSRQEIEKAVASWLTANNHSFTKVVFTKHCN
tara:strand:+ start:780 stop:1061 length:282 start_codon:yes stop_codon:yes gene_type:complete